MDLILRQVKTYQPIMLDLIGHFVECESPSDDRAAVNRFVDLVGSVLAPWARLKTVPGGRVGHHLLAEMKLPGRKKSGQILALGHSDTVWPVGTLRSMPFRNHRGRVYGPGVLDMKAGIVFFIAAARALLELDLPVASRVLLQLNSDEEVGSESSRALTEENARASHTVLVLEPGTGLEGKLKTARKGVGAFT
ncbi:MAG: M20/M25/M40 family metallo-hydrolase, partial [Bryobacteraceae bacterium]